MGRQPTILLCKVNAKHPNKKVSHAIFCIMQLSTHYFIIHFFDIRAIFL